ncbi:spore germination protein GerW family protein [Sagittula sp. S175]|uniref:spore germination protein GerW family protein n=1 Tax=Sagittula sp. S175 TaxID=3415129 RepID=UPI003C7D8D9A
MQDVDKLLKSTVEELDRLLSARNVLGEPIERDGATVIPIVSFGFGFGAGGQSGGTMGERGGTGAGGGIKPLGAIIIDANGARVEEVKGTTSSIVETAAKVANKALDRRTTPPPVTG